MRWMIILSVMALSGCGDRRTFDERYNDTAGNLVDRSNRIENDLNQAEQAEQDAK